MSPNWSRALSNWRKPLLLGATVALLLVGGLIALARWDVAVDRDLVGIDREIYLGFANRFLETGSQYLPHQLIGPYDDRPPVNADPLPSLYPPTALSLFVPFVWLPAVLWWAIPLGVLGWLLVRWRPAAWAWPLIAAGVAWPETTTMIIVGNSSMWLVAAGAAGLAWGWPAALALVKPSLAFVAILGMRRVEFWVVTGAGLVLSLLLLPEWVRWFIAMRHVTATIDYSLGSIPALLIPLFAWMARRRPQSAEPVAIDVQLASQRPATVEVELG